MNKIIAGRDRLGWPEATPEAKQRSKDIKKSKRILEKLLKELR